jgi:hypothetical protein
MTLAKTGPVTRDWPHDPGETEAMAPGENAHRWPMSLATDNAERSTPVP